MSYNMRSHTRQRGYTLTELLVTIAMLAVMVLLFIVGVHLVIKYW